VAKYFASDQLWEESPEGWQHLVTNLLGSISEEANGPAVSHNIPR